MNRHITKLQRIVPLEMGKATRWFKGLFGFKKSKKERQNRVSSGYNGKGGDHILTIDSISHTEKEHNNQEIAVAIAVKAAVKIQSAFRGCLARKALRALRGLVKLQAIVRGYLVRKRAAEMFRSIQALIRVQNDVRSKRINRCLNKEYNMFQPRPCFDMLANETQFETSPKMVEINDNYSRSRLSTLRSKQVHNIVAMSECGDDLEKWKFATAKSSPIRHLAKSSPSRHFSSLQRATAATPKAAAAAAAAANDCYYVLESPEEGFWTYEGSMTPSYMGKTESFKAKLRSHSTPRQRLERKRFSLDEEIASKSSVSGLSMQSQRPRYSCSYGL